MTEPAGRPDAPRSIVYLIDDDESVRAAIEDLLTSVGLRARSFCSTQQFIEEGPTDDPGCLVLDVRMPGQSGLDFQRQMKNLGIRLPVIFITGHGNIAMTVRAMKEGAIDFLAKPFDEQALLDAIQQGIEQDRARRDKEARLAAVLERYGTLSIGEREVMDLVAQGLPNRQIAERLSLSEITVKVRRGHVMRKMEAESVAELVRMHDLIALTNINV